MLLETHPMPPLSAAAIENYVERYLSGYIPHHLIEPERLIQEDMERAVWNSHGCQIVLVEEYPLESIEAQTNFPANKIEVTEKFMIELENENPRSRYTLAHEIGHIILHSKIVMQLALLAARRNTERPIKTYEDAEWQAEHAAGALLMPIVTLLPLLCTLYESNYSDRKTVQEVKDIYGVSVRAAEARTRAVLKLNMEKKRNEVIKNKALNVTSIQGLMRLFQVS
ncbi:ImmA/IrrE family metallo-endopeptidase [Treponema sp. OMZ 840]|uniref:ImmA/IrrE family metallo-endopeptidase n=1 Tax=Treponema sp. OMZ 840 TaxID=244313 RepID=UPI003D8A889E